MKLCKRSVTKHRVYQKPTAFRHAIHAAALLTVILFPVGVVTAQSAPSSSFTASVNPFIGTGTSTGVPGGVNAGNQNLFPGPSLPFGTVQLSPDTESTGFGYHYSQDKIQGFSMTHMSGVGCDNEGLVFFSPTTGDIRTETTAFESPYKHSRERASPGYYQVDLSRWNIGVELTATEHTGAAQFSFPQGEQANILLPISHTLNYVISSQAKVVGNKEIQGYVEDRAFCNVKQTYKVYYDIVFSKPFASFGTWDGKNPKEQAKLQKGTREVSSISHTQWIGAYASWPGSKQPQKLTMRIGISYVSLAGAKDNLAKESGSVDFAELHKKANQTWQRALGSVVVTGGSQKNRSIFYTALYHSLLMPTVVSDADGKYLGFDQKVHQAAHGHQVYSDFSGWDIYRSQIPLVALIEPKRMQDIAQSIVLMARQGGWIGRWPQANLYTNIMAGSPLTVILCTTWLDGLRGFDMDHAWPAMWQDATEAPAAGNSYEGEVGVNYINSLHFVPNDKVKYGSVAQIQEDTIAYASLYHLAKELGKADAAKIMYQRALYYRNSFNPQDKFFRPRNADGKWTPNFKPTQQEGFIEGSGWHYQWFAPTDLAWLIEAVGKDNFNSRLTHFFDYPKSGWYSDYYNPYNETDLQAPFEFNFSGQPWKSQQAVRRALKEAYGDDPDGVPGNDDSGEMSSWAVLSMMGVYSVDPASLAYELVSPLFPKVVVRLQAPYKGRTLTIETSPQPESRPFIQSVKLNGKRYTKNWLSFHDLTSSATLNFQLGSQPNLSWGSNPSDAPPSMSQSKP